MEKNQYIVLYTLKHAQNSEEGNKVIQCSRINANTYGKAELIIKTDWAKLNSEATIIQITLYN